MMRIPNRPLCIACAFAGAAALALVIGILAPAPAAAQADQGDIPKFIEGMTPAQVSQFMEIAQKVNCPCGCGRGTLMQCRLTDPGCGTSPRMLNTAASLIKAGQDTGTIIASLAAPPPAPAAPAKPAPTPAGTVPLADGDSPFKGAKNAKVTIYEFSDFQ